MTSRRILSALFIAMLAIIVSAPAWAQRSEVSSETEERTESVNEAEGCCSSGLIGTLERARQAQIKAFSGSWEGVFTPEEGGPPPFLIHFTFGADGTVVESDGGPPDPQNATPGHGVWERTSNGEFTVIYKQLIFDSAGNVAVRFKARVKFRLDQASNAISGVVKVDLADADGNVFLSGAGTIKCTKIKIEPLD